MPSYIIYRIDNWMSAKEVAQLFNTSVDEFAPEKFKQVYFDTWIKDHEEEAAKMSPNPEPETEIIEQVKNETNSVDDTANTTPVQPDSTAEVVAPAVSILSKMTLGVEDNLCPLLQGSYPVRSLVFKRDVVLEEYSTDDWTRSLIMA